VSGAAVVRFHGFVLDVGCRTVSRGGRRVHLTRKAFDLLVVLVEHAPQVVTKDQLHGLLWRETFVTDATVAGVVKELRRVFRDHDCREPLVRTVHGIGYAFTGSLQARSNDDPTDAHYWLISGTRHLVLSEGSNDIGRDPQAAIWLDSPQASRRHARITIADDVARLEDLGSKNCTLVNDRRVTGPTPLNDGDSIQIGSTVLVFRVLHVTASTETAAGTPPG
jgi:DNA-binding winged helix-turn-helix (wHTH) protein